MIKGRCMHKVRRDSPYPRDRWRLAEHQIAARFGTRAVVDTARNALALHLRERRAAFCFVGLVHHDDRLATRERFIKLSPTVLRISNVRIGGGRRVSGMESKKNIRGGLGGRDKHQTRIHRGRVTFEAKYPVVRKIVNVADSRTLSSSLPTDSSCG